MTQVDETANDARAPWIFAVIMGAGTVTALLLLWWWLSFFANPTGFYFAEYEDRLFFDLSTDTASTQLIIASPMDTASRGWLTIDPEGEYDEQLGSLVVMIDGQAPYIVEETPSDPIDLGEFTANDKRAVYATLQDFENPQDDATVMLPVLVQFS